MNKLRIILTGFFMLIALTAPVPVGAQLESLKQSCIGVDSPICNDLRSEQNPTTGTDSIFVTIANILAIIAGIIAVIIIIIAGITMMTSGGDSGKVKSSRDTIIYAAIGIVVIVLARTLVLYVINLIG